jgi:hypothetical protein
MPFCIPFTNCQLQAVKYYLLWHPGPAIHFIRMRDTWGIRIVRMASRGVVALQRAFHGCSLDTRSASQVGRSLVLKPYRRRYVPKYHAWMEDAWLRGGNLARCRSALRVLGRATPSRHPGPALADMTASERLSMEEELRAQAEWREDPNSACARRPPG